MILAALAAVAMCKEEEGCEQGYGHCHKRRLLKQSDARQADAERQMFREPWPADSELDKEASLLLQQVVVVHRHGDRAPLSMTIGSWEQTPELEDFWKTRLPAKSTIEKWGMYGTDSSGIYLKPKGEHSATGWPWGHLTNVGADQLRALGARLRERYNTISSTQSLQLPMLLLAWALCPNTILHSSARETPVTPAAGGPS